MLKLICITIFEILLTGEVTYARNVNNEMTFVHRSEIDGMQCDDTNNLSTKWNINSAVRCAAHCQQVLQCRSFFYKVQGGLCIGCNLEYNTTSGLSVNSGTKYFNMKTNDSLSRDCKAILENTTYSMTGVYNILPPGSRQSVWVLCDMEYDGGGWTVFQHRFNGMVNFTRLMADYVFGFGSPYTEYWLGLESIHLLTKDTDSLIYMHFSDANDNVAMEIGRNFLVRGGPLYKLRVGAAVFVNDSKSKTGYILRNYNGVPFSAIDQDNDMSQSRDCAALFRSAGWHRNCNIINPNGEYITPGTVSTHNKGRGGIVNQAWRGLESLKSTKLMFRRLD